MCMYVNDTYTHIKEATPSMSVMVQWFKQCYIIALKDHWL